MKTLKTLSMVTAVATSALLAGCLEPTDVGDVDEEIASVEQEMQSKHDTRDYNSGYNLFLFEDIQFEPIQAGADADAGRVLFGLAPDMNTSDDTGAKFEGFSFVAGRPIVSNGRTCFTCHRGLVEELGMPVPPMSATIPLTDPLFTGIEADNQFDPRGASNLENLGLIKYRPHRFNPARSQEDPYRKLLFWRKSPALLNVGLTNSLLLEGRGRTMRETDQGAVMSHTQNLDDRFDDLFTEKMAADLTAFLFTQVTDPVLLALRDPSDPMHDTLVNDPFYTVPVTTKAQKRGKKVFEKQCFTCHNMPNVFSNRSSAMVLGADGLSPRFPSHGPGTGRSYNIGISERNKHNLTFDHFDGVGFSPMILPLANDDGTINNFHVTIDIGLASATARTADIGRFKVPQLRGIKNLAPYFHDNSALTLEEVIDYFDSPEYNNSKDGKLFPVKLNQKQKQDLLEFLLIL